MLIEFNTKSDFVDDGFGGGRYAPERRPPGVVLGIEDGPSPVGSTFWKTLFRCPREHALRNEAGVRSIHRWEHFDVGWLFHVGLEEYYGAIRTHQEALNRYLLSAKDRNTDQYLWGNLPDAERRAFEKVIDPLSAEPGYCEPQRTKTGRALPSTVEVLTTTLGAYFDHYRRRDRWRVIGQEATLQVPDELYGFAYSTRLDTLVEDYDPTYAGMWIVEHKTARSVTEDLLLSYQLDIQILGQVWLVLHCLDLSQLPPFRGVVINITTKHKTPRFERLRVTPSLDHLRMFERTMYYWHEMREEAELRGWPQAIGHCAGAPRGYTRCDYYNLCHGRPDVPVERLMKDDLPYGYVRLGDPEAAELFAGGDWSSEEW